MSEAQNHELGFVKAFIAPARRDRWVTTVQSGSAKARKKLVEALPHALSSQLDPRHIIPVPHHLQRPDLLAQILTKLGGTAQCWVTSEAADLDGSFHDMQTALEGTLCRGLGTILSVVPGELAFFESEEMERWVLAREPGLHRRAKELLET